MQLVSQALKILTDERRQLENRLGAIRAAEVQLKQLLNGGGRSAHSHGFTTRWPARTLSAEARERIAEAQRKRWAKQKGKRSTMSAAGRARIAAAQRARWAKYKRAA